MLFETIARVENLYCLNKEADIVWWENFPYHRTVNPSDYVGLEELSWRKKIDLREDFYKKAVTAHAKRHNKSRSFLEKIGTKPIQYFDKTIANCFHLEPLNELFPDARYIFLKRDPRANISSMIEGWKYIDRFGKRQLNPILSKNNNTTINHWSYPAPPGWENIVTKSLPEICSWSWKQHIQYVIKFFEKRDQPLYQISYEEINEDPLDSLTNILDWLGINFNKDIRKSFKNLPLSRTTVSKPESEKWKRKNYQEIIDILPKIKDTANKIGYNI